MNKRQYKKFLKKHKSKSYKTKRLRDIISKIPKTNNSNTLEILHIVDSKRMNLKHPIKVEYIIGYEPLPQHDEPKTFDLNIQFIGTKPLINDTNNGTIELFQKIYNGGIGNEV